MKKVILVGAGGHAAELREYISYLNFHDSQNGLDIVGFLDDDKEIYSHYSYSEPWLGKLSTHKVLPNVWYLMAIANLQFRKVIIEDFSKKGARFTGFVHPTALVAATAVIGEGTVISHNASVGPKVKIGSFNMLNSRCTIGHDTQIGDFNFISPQVALSGNTVVGSENLIGTNVCTIPGIRIGNSNKIGAGMTVYKNIGDKETVFFRFKERIVVKPFNE